MDLQLQPPLQTDLRSQALLALINRLKGLDLSPILVYRIPSLVDSAVLAMAWQWDVLNSLLLPVPPVVGPPTSLTTGSFRYTDVITDVDTLLNWDLLQYATGTGTGSPTPVPLALLYAQYRALILLSTQLHSIIGTPAALQQALAGLGFPDALILEGQDSWGGTQWPADQGWAVFRVVINLLTVPQGTDIQGLGVRIVAIANYWKPARCWLDSAQFTLPVFDTLIPPITDRLINIFSQQDFLIPVPSDFIVGQFWPLTDIKVINPYYNDRYYFGSNITYGGTQPTVADGPVVINGTPVNE